MSTEWVPLCKRPNIPIYHIFTITLAQLTSNMIWTPTGVLMNPMLQKAGLSNTVISLVYLMGPISGMLISPVIGIISDNTLWKIGRRRGWLIIGEALATVGMLLLALGNLSNNKVVVAVCAFIGYFTACNGGNMVSMAGRALVTDVMPRHQQVLGSNVCMVQQGISGVLSNAFTGAKLKDYFEGLPFGYEEFVLVISCVIGFIALAVCCITTREEKLDSKIMTGSLFRNMWLVFKQFNTNMLLMATGHCFIAMGNNQWNAQYGPYFGKIIYGGKATADSDDESYLVDLYNDGVAMAGWFLCGMTVVQIIFSFTSHFLTNKVGLRWTWAVGMTTGIIGTGLMNIRFNRKNMYALIVPIIMYAYFLVVCGGIPTAVVSLYLDPDTMCCAQGILNFIYCIGQFACILIVQLGLGNLSSYYEDKGELNKFGPGNLIGVSPVWLAISLVSGFIGIARTESQTMPVLDDDFKQKVDEPNDEV